MTFAAFRRRAAGVFLMALGAVALFVPLAAGRWSLSLLAVPLFASSIVQAYGALTSPQRVTASAYLPSLLTMLAGLLLFFSSALVINGLLLLLIAILAMGGFSKILIAWRADRSYRTAAAVNGFIDLSCAALLWSLSGLIRVEQAIGIATGAYIAAAGWRLLAAPAQAAEPEAPTAAATSHPDPKLRLTPSETFARLRAEAKSGARTVLASDFTWMLTLAVVFFAIHLGRMPISDTVLGLSSPFVATAGDLFMAAVLGLLLVLPAHLLWKRITRAVERLAWSLRLDPKPGAAPNPAADWLISRWLEGRFNFDLRLDAARNSLRAALILVLGLGLPLTAFFVAFNPAWGFTWYFNTESWATGVYQKLTEARVDDWRAAMTGAVRRAYGGESDDLFAIDPGGLEGFRDFSFLVVGDPGEGDASQYALISRYLELGRRDDVKFLVVSSDVIYPAGAIEDYERNFYLPFQGFAKPVYAIPGNHDWYDALEGFNANFLEPKAARAAIEARVEADHGLTSTNARRMDRFVAEAARLRGLCGVDVAHQRAPFFELQTQDFALLAIDTGILRSVDSEQWAWLERALDRSRGKFTMAIVGHPRFAGGHDTPPTAAEGGDVSDASGNFAALYRLLANRNVKIAMAGDTHDFEYYKEKVGGDGPARIMHHFVNGGGGAYLSIGTALDFAKQPDVADWAFYPRTDNLRSKMEAEMPLWKEPFWRWITWFNAWPVSVEALSGVFDFNRARFFQSFMEVRVERSKRRVALILNGVRGPLHWRDLQVNGDVLPPRATLDDPVEFLVPMDRN